MHINTFSYTTILATLFTLSFARSFGVKQHHRNEIVPAADTSFRSPNHQQAPLSDHKSHIESTPPSPNLPNCHQSSANLLPPIPLMPPSNSDGSTRDPNPSNPSSSVTLSDVLPKTSRINIFASFTRDISTVSDRLDAHDLNTTVLAPLNSVLQSLPRKPWEDPKDYDSLGTQAYAGDEGEDRAHWNLRRFVEGQVVTTSPWEKGEKVKTMGGKEVWWEEKDGKKVVMPGNVIIDGILDTVGNGEVWAVKGVLESSK